MEPPVKKKRKSRRAPRWPLRELLARYGWSQRQLSFATKIGQPQIGSYVRGKCHPTYPNILRIMTTIGADLGDLVLRPEGGKA